MTEIQKMIDEKDKKISELTRQVSQMLELLDAERAISRLPKNLDFVQVSRADIRAIGELGEKNSTALNVLMILTQTMSKQNAVMLSYEAMMEISGKPRRTLARAIDVLKKDNWIQVVKVGTANVYVVNSAVFWTDRNDRKSLASFSAQIVTTLDEQEKDLRQCPDVKLKRLPFFEKNERIILGDDQLPPPDQQDFDLN